MYLKKWLGFGNSSFIPFPKAWNPFIKGSAIVLLASNSRMSKSGGGNSSCISTPDVVVNPGDHKYAEIRINSFTSGIAFGLAKAGIDTSQDLGHDAFGWAFRTFLGTPDIFHNNSSSSYGGGAIGVSAGQTWGIELDYTQTGGTTLSVTFYKNDGTVNGAGAILTGLTGTYFIAAGTVVSNVFDLTENFQAPFIHAVPSGATGF